MNTTNNHQQQSPNTTDFGCITHAESGTFAAYSYVVAIVMALLAAVLNNVGVNVQKLAWTWQQQGKKTHVKRMWTLGFVGISLASFLDIAALGFGPQSLISPLGSFTMVLNGFVAPCLLGEEVRIQVLFATMIIVTGCVMAVATASHVNTICTASALKNMYESDTFVGIILIVIFINIVVLSFVHYAETLLQKHGVDSVQYGRVFKFHRISHSFLSGLWGAMSVTFARSLGMMVNGSITGANADFFLRGFTWGVITGLVICVVFQLVELNKGLSRFESTYCVPMFTTTFILGCVILGGVFYGEFNSFDVVSQALFPLGILLCLAGVFWLAQGAAASKKNDGDKKQLLGNEEASVLPPSPVSVAGTNKKLEEIESKPSAAGIEPESEFVLFSGGMLPFVMDLNVPPHVIHDVQDPNGGTHLLETRGGSDVGLLLTGTPTPAHIQQQQVVDDVDSNPNTTSMIIV